MFLGSERWLFLILRLTRRYPSLVKPCDTISGSTYMKAELPLLNAQLLSGVWQDRSQYASSMHEKSFNTLVAQRMLWGQMTMLTQCTIPGTS